MVEEQGRVVALEPGAVWVETVRATACQSCSANKACGHAVMDRNAPGSKARIRVLCEQPISVGSQVIVGIPEGALLKGALLIYLLPLVLLFIGALIGNQWTGLDGDGSAILGGLGLLAGFLFNRLYSNRWASQDIEPRILGVLPGS